MERQLRLHRADLLAVAERRDCYGAIYIAELCRFGQQKAWFLMPQVCVSAQLRPAAKLYRAVGQSISAERALSFLQAHPGELTLSRARAALLENKEVQAAVLVQTGGGFRLGG